MENWIILCPGPSLKNVYITYDEIKSSTIVAVNGALLHAYDVTDWWVLMDPEVFTTVSKLPVPLVRVSKRTKLWTYWGFEEMGKSHDGARWDDLFALVNALREMGADVERLDGTIRVSARRRLAAIDVTTLPFPGFPTDLQAQMMAALTTANGISVVTEKIFPDRFMHVAELGRMGARIRKQGNAAVVHGTDQLSGAPVMASDLRASAALVIAALMAEGKTTIARIYHLDRGYEGLERKLRRLGGRIRRIKE